MFAGETGAEVAGDEGVESAETGGELGVGEATVAMESSEKVCSGEIAFQEITFLAAGNEVAAGIIAQLGAWDDVIDAAG